MRNKGLLVGLDIQVKELKDGAYRITMSAEGYAMFNAALAKGQTSSLHDFHVITTQGVI